MKALVISGGGVNIYTLTDPRTNQVRYVGKTNNITKRFNKHINESLVSTKSHKNAWIRGLSNEGLKPIIDIIDIVTNEEWQYWESYWISQFKTWGFNLVNSTNGGEGVDIGNKPWNTGTKGVMKPNKTSIKLGQRLSPKTEIKKGERLNPKTEFKKGVIPHNITSVGKFSLDGILIEVYPSFIIAANKNYVSQSAISKGVREKCKIKNFLWKKM